MSDEAVIVVVDDHCIQGMSQFYSRGNELLALIGSSGYLEIALRDGSAAIFWGAKVGDEVTLRAVEED